MAVALPGLNFPNLFPTPPTIPGLAAARVTATGKGWVPIQWKNPIDGSGIRFLNTPTILALYESYKRPFPLQTITFTAPSIPGVQAIQAITAVSIPLPILVYDAGGDYGWTAGNIPIKDKAGREAYRAARSVLGDWGLMNWARDVVASMAQQLAIRAIGATVDAVVGEVVKGINTKIADVTGSINRGLDNVNRVFTTLNTNLNTSLRTGATDASDAINKVLPKLWEMLGLDRELVGSIAAVRNTSTTGCEVYAPDASVVINVFAIGAKA